MWEYFEQNICTDKMVAEFKKMNVCQFYVFMKLDLILLLNLVLIMVMIL